MSDNVIKLLKNQNILYAEDQKELHESMEETLSFFFNRVYIASDGEEALQILEEENIDVALIDIEMPKLDGIEVARKIRAKNDKLLIIFLTAYVDQKYLFDAIKIKVEDYLVKPLNFEELLGVFKKIYKKPKLSEKIHKLKSGDIFYEKEALIDTGLEKIKLGDKEAQLLVLLLKFAPNTLNKSIIDEELWNYEMTESSYRSLVRNLRQKLPKDIIQTVPRVGLRLETK